MFLNFFYVIGCKSVWKLILQHIGDDIINKITRFINPRLRLIFLQIIWREFHFNKKNCHLSNFFLRFFSKKKMVESLELKI